MDSASAIRFLQDAAANPSALGETEKAQLMGACSQYVEAVAPVEKRLMDLLYAVSLLRAPCGHLKLTVSTASEGCRNTLSDRHGYLRCCSC